MRVGDLVHVDLGHEDRSGKSWVVTVVTGSDHSMEQTETLSERRVAPRSPR